jgi:hypothetical protein
MVTTSLPITLITQNLWSIFCTMWNVFSNVTPPPWLMISWGYAIFYTFVSCLDMYNITNYHSMKTSLFALANSANFMEIVFWISFFPFGNLGSYAFNLYKGLNILIPKVATNCQETLTDILIPKVENFDKMVQMVADNQWLQRHPKLMRKFVIKDVGSNGSTWTTTPLVREFIKSSWELVLGLLGFGMLTPNIVALSLKVVMNFMCCVQCHSTTWNFIWTFW